MVHHAARRMSESIARGPSFLLRVRGRSHRIDHSDRLIERAAFSRDGYCGRVSAASGEINLDAIAGAPLSPAVIKAWQSAAAGAYSDPARMHHAGRQAGLLLESARSSIATSLDCSPQQVFFAGSAAEALRAAINGIYRLRTSASARVVVGAVESMAVLNAVSNLPGADIVTIGIDSLGRIDLGQLERELAAGAALVCIQVANAEVGTRQPIAEVLTLARAAQVPVVSDATAVITHDPLPTDFDVLIAPARDWGGPPGVALLLTTPMVRWRPEEAPDRGWIGGFPDIPAAVAAAVALEETTMQPASASTTRGLIDQVRHTLNQLDAISCVGDPVDRLPHILTCIISGAAAGELVTALDKHGIYVASGSACTADARMPSHVLQAMGLPHESSIRISLPVTCTQSQIDHFLTAMPQILSEVINS